MKCCGGLKILGNGVEWYLESERSEEAVCESWRG